MRGALSLILAAFLAVLAIACDDEPAPEPSPTSSPSASPPATASPAPTPTVATETPSPAVSPLPESVACAAGSTQRFREVDAEAPWPVYCPTFVPEGLSLTELRFTPLDVTPEMDAPPPGELNAAFVSADNETQVVLYQGRLGASFVSSLVRLADEEGVSPETVTYGDVEGILYAPLTTITDVALGAFIVVEFPDGITHVLHTAEVDVATVREIAAQMQPVSP